MKQVRMLLMICIMIGLIASLLISSCNSGKEGGIDVIVFARTEETNWTTDIFTMNPDGTNQTNISNWSDSFDDTWGICCSPNGDKIAFSGQSNVGAGYYDIYVMNADGTGILNLTNTNDENETEPSWSPDGTKIAFTNFSAIYIMNSNGTGRYQLSHSGDYSEYTPEHPSWSPDGTKLVFADWKDGSTANIYIHDFGSGVTSDIVYGWSPTWSSDGTKIAFAGGANLHELNVINADGSGETTIYDLFEVDNNYIWTIAWSPDGEKIAFDVEYYDKDDIDICVINSDGTNFQNITNTTGADERFPAWLP